MVCSLARITRISVIVVFVANATASRFRTKREEEFRPFIPSYVDIRSKENTTHAPTISSAAFAATGSSSGLSNATKWSMPDPLSGPMPLDSGIPNATTWSMPDPMPPDISPQMSPPRVHPPMRPPLSPPMQRPLDSPMLRPTESPIHPEMQTPTHSEMHSPAHLEMQSPMHPEVLSPMQSHTQNTKSPSMQRPLESPRHHPMEPPMHPQMHSDMHSDLHSDMHSEIHSEVHTQMQSSNFPSVHRPLESPKHHPMETPMDESPMHSEMQSPMHPEMPTQTQTPKSPPTHRPMESAKSPPMPPPISPAVLPTKPTKSSSPTPPPTPPEGPSAAPQGPQGPPKPEPTPSQTQPSTAPVVADSPTSPLKYYQERCASSKGDGSCYPAAECQRLGGVGFELCPGRRLQCCVFERSCGDVSSERLTYFQSPDFPAQSMGTLACDYDVAIQSDVCAVRIEYEKVQLARKLGGVCDIDQIFILNSVDGPTTGQCGPLSGYSTTVAVNPGQPKPVKLAILVQNEAYYHWRIKVMQIRCSQLRNFHAPGTCGRKDQDITADATEEFMETFPNIFHLWQDVKWRRHSPRSQGGVWWSFPEPVFNTFYYGTMKKHLQLQSTQSVQVSRPAQERIVGGSDAELYEFPWQVAIFLEDLFFCGGALINDQFVLTAAHCLMTRDTPVESIVLQLGDHDLTTINETAHVTRRVRTVLFHSHFHPFLLANDIAMLRLDKPVALSYRVRPVCLPNPAESYTGRQGTVVGWGITSFPMGEPSPILQKLSVETLSNFQCARIIEEPVGLGMLCAAPASFQGTCFGDSGGPMTITEPDGTDVLVGLVSFGVTGCAVIPAFPDLYTRVSEYLKWIDVNAIT